MKRSEHPEESISAYIDGELPEDETRDLFRHLGTCAECRGTMSSLLRLRSALHAAEKEERSPAMRRLTLTFPAAAAVAAALIAGTMYLSSLVLSGAPPAQRAEPYIAPSPLPAVYVIEPAVHDPYRTN